MKSLAAFRFGYELNVPFLDVLARIDHREIESRLEKTLLIVFSESSEHYKSQNTHRRLEA